VSFLLITAVWSQMARLEADAQIPGTTTETPREGEVDKVLSVEVKREDRFLLVWRKGNTVHAMAEVPRTPVQVPAGDGTEVRCPALEKAISSQWEKHGSHRNLDDGEQDQAVLSVHDHTPFSEIVGVIDAIYTPARTFQGREVQALHVTFATR